MSLKVKKKGRKEMHIRDMCTKCLYLKTLQYSVPLSEKINVLFVELASWIEDVVSVTAFDQIKMIGLETIIMKVEKRASVSYSPFFLHICELFSWIETLLIIISMFGHTDNCSRRVFKFPLESAYETERYLAIVK